MPVPLVDRLEETGSAREQTKRTSPSSLKGIVVPDEVLLMTCIPGSQLPLTPSSATRHTPCSRSSANTAAWVWSICFHASEWAVPCQSKSRSVTSISYSLPCPMPSSVVVFGSQISSSQNQTWTSSKAGTWTCAT
ncbi:uncharacterized protein LOC110982151 [Acanthaster planci]|uniref:Uncharacterized protein LOC110982151 n=1 Tax=Acanthaster planci TaxID=133434 RepID=A0A8B7YS16_ACAPL|nr:uncharacterized protein LOC110982151 [Acanthaster planci]